jgi:hypothetical protein
MSIFACVAIALVVVLVVSAGAGNGATRVRTHPKPRPDRGTLSLLSDSLKKNLEEIRISLLSFRLKTILNKVTAVAPAFERRLLELSRVVQGGRCEGYVAEVLQVCDAPKVVAGTDADVPEDPEGAWRYANELADAYLPLFKEYLRELQSLRPSLVEVGTPRPLKMSRDLLLKSCNLQLKATRAFIRGLELVRDCNEMTVGQALELVREAVATVGEGTVSLQGAVDSLALND